jgi:hypothetical protein
MDQKFVYVVHIENAFCHVHKLLRNFIENKIVNRKFEKGGWSVPRAPVI